MVLERGRSRRKGAGSREKEGTGDVMIRKAAIRWTLPQRRRIFTSVGEQWFCRYLTDAIGSANDYYVEKLQMTATLNH